MRTVSGQIEPESDYKGENVYHVIETSSTFAALPNYKELKEFSAFCSC